MSGQGPSQSAASLRASFHRSSFTKQQAPIVAGCCWALGHQAVPSQRLAKTFPGAAP